MSRSQSRKSVDTPTTTHTDAHRAVFVVLGVVVVGAFLVAVALSGGNTEEMPEAGTVALSGTALPEFAGGPSSDTAVGMIAPTLSGADFAGNEISITNDGRPKVILFLAHWCIHCQREVPAVQAYADTVGFPEEVDFYSVATAYTPTKPNWPPSAWLAREGWSFPVVVDDPDSSAFAWFGRGGFPYYVFIDSSGVVELRLSGEQDPATLAGILSELAG
ncbi:MAG: TlpA disulfide reductase family protein [Acidimicrobiia bacterium]|nr:TlpA disulfide reductase family protein [Acidimicrobiia bacterium]